MDRRAIARLLVAHHDSIPVFPSGEHGENRRAGETKFYLRLLLGVIIARLRLQSDIFPLGPSRIQVELIQKFRPALGISCGLRSSSFHLILLAYFLYLFFFGALFFRFCEQVARPRLVSILHIRARRRAWPYSAKALDVRRRAQFFLFCRTADVDLPALRLAAILRATLGRPPICSFTPRLCRNSFCSLPISSSCAKIDRSR